MTFGFQLGSLSLHSTTLIDWVFFEKIENKFSQRPKIFWIVHFSNSAAVLIKCNIKGPMQIILNLPMIPDNASKLLCIVLRLLM